MGCSKKWNSHGSLCVGLTSLLAPGVAVRVDKADRLPLIRGDTSNFTSTGCIVLMRQARLSVELSLIHHQIIECTVCVARRSERFRRKKKLDLNGWPNRHYAGVNEPPKSLRTIEGAVSKAVKRLLTGAPPRPVPFGRRSAITWAVRAARQRRYGNRRNMEARINQPGDSGCECRHAVARWDFWGAKPGNFDDQRGRNQYRSGATHGGRTTPSLRTASMSLRKKTCEKILFVQAQQARVRQARACRSLETLSKISKQGNRVNLHYRAGVAPA